LEIPTGYSEDVTLRADNAMSKRKRTTWQTDLQNSTQKTNDWTTGTTLTTKDELRCSRRVSSFCSTCGNML
jgi:hypothetical protein